MDAQRRRLCTKPCRSACRSARVRPHRASGTQRRRASQSHTNGEPVDVRFERPSNWDGAALVFTDIVPTPNGDLTISFRYELQDAGSRLRASEVLRGAGREQDNVWVFDRAATR